MWIGWLEFDLLLGDVHSLKQKRSAVRPVIAELHRRFGVSASAAGLQIGLTVAGGGLCNGLHVYSQGQHYTLLRCGALWPATRSSASVIAS